MSEQVETTTAGETQISDSILDELERIASDYQRLMYDPLSATNGAMHAWVINTTHTLLINEMSRRRDNLRKIRHD